MFSNKYSVVVSRESETSTSFFNKAFLYKLTVYKGDENVTNNYSYNTLKVRTGVQLAEDFTSVYVNSEEDNVPLPTLMEYL